MGELNEKRLTPAEKQAVEQHRESLAKESGRAVGYDEALADWLEHCAVAWREARQAEFLAGQREEILRHKWLESEKAHRDLGSEAVLDWIRNHAAAWRKWYEEGHGGAGV